MAQTMMQSHRDIVPVTIVDDVDITDLPANTDITVHLLKAIVAAAKVEPALNAWFDGKTLERKLFTDVHIGLAIDTAEGLFVSVIKEVNNQSQETLRDKVNTYKEAIRARAI